MFQYASAKVQADRIGCQLLIYPAYAGRKALLNAVLPRSTFEILNLFPNLPFGAIDRAVSLYRGFSISRMRRSLPPFVRKTFIAKVKQPEGNELYDNEIWNIDDRTLLIGEFQSEKYFKDFREMIVSLFAPSEAIRSQISIAGQTLPYKKSDFVSVHVRLGDYLIQLDPYSKVKTGWALPAEYYFRALEKFPADMPIALFSDDLANARKLLPRPPAWESPSLSPGFDLFMMSSFKNQIIANSSFSWWSAWLNRDPSKFIVGPKFHIGWRHKNWLPGNIEVDEWTYV